MSPYLTRRNRAEYEAERDMHSARAKRAEAAQSAVKAAFDALAAKLRTIADGDEFEDAITEFQRGADDALSELQHVKERAASEAGISASEEPRIEQRRDAA